MSKYVCTICGFVYDEALGIPEAGIDAGTKWKDLSWDWICPVCGAAKADFKMLDEPISMVAKQPVLIKQQTSDIKEMTPLEISALCSNLARGCEKQYKAEEATLFRELGDYFNKASVPADSPNVNQLVALIEKDLEEEFPNAHAVASEEKDRGALRALVWSEKVTRILKSLLVRYEKEGEAMIKNTGIYVCTICGFIFVGDVPPDICPVCKVPSWKFEKIEGKA